MMVNGYGQFVALAEGVTFLVINFYRSEYNICV